jgi:cysteine desulfurase
MEPYFSDRFYNPSSPYIAGKQIRTALNDAKLQIGKVIGSKPAEVIFTAGATESINIAIQGVMAANPGGHIVTSAIEHPAVLNTVKNFDHTFVKPEHNGLVAPESIRNSIKENTVLISIGYVNNEIGTVQRLSEIGRIVKDVRASRTADHNKTPIYLHTDASQAAGLFDLHTARLGVDLLTLNAGKCYGPKQVGLLWVKTGVVIKPVIFGGGQEYGQRSGTENVAGSIGLAEALKIADGMRHEEVKRIGNLRDKLQNKIVNALPDTVVSGHPKLRSPANLHLAWPRLDGERLLYALDNEGILVATGSACAANKGTRSHVLEAIGLKPDIADGSVRITLGRYTTETEVDKTAELIIRLVNLERSK